MHIRLRSGERFYVNGAVLRVDRKVSMELLNDVTFLLESHVLHADQATTPLRQLYFIVQTILIEPARAAEARRMFDHLHALLLASLGNATVRDGLLRVRELVAVGRVVDALKVIRSLLPAEATILAAGPRPWPAAGDGNQEVGPWK